MANNGKPQMVIGDGGKAHIQWAPGVKTYTGVFIGGADIQHDLWANGEEGLANFVAGIRNTWAAGRVPVLSGLSVFLPDAPPVEPAIPFPTVVVEGHSGE